MSRVTDVTDIYISTVYGFKINLLSLIGLRVIWKNPTHPSQRHAGRLMAVDPKRLEFSTGGGCAPDITMIIASFDRLCGHSRALIEQRVHRLRRPLAT
jgi:hypothetical protein